MTSLHIDEYVADARDTKLGPEEITSDIPNVSENMLAGLMKMVLSELVPVLSLAIFLSVKLL